MLTTKDQERAALDRIRKIVAELGPDSYIGMAFTGVPSLAYGKSQKVILTTISVIPPAKGGSRHGRKRRNKKRVPMKRSNGRKSPSRTHRLTLKDSVLYRQRGTASAKSFLKSKRKTTI